MTTATYITYEATTTTDIATATCFADHVDHYIESGYTYEDAYEQALADVQEQDRAEAEEDLAYFNQLLDAGYSTEAAYEEAEAALVEQERAEAEEAEQKAFMVDRVNHHLAAGYRLLAAVEEATEEWQQYLAALRQPELLA